MAAGLPHPPGGCSLQSARAAGQLRHKCTGARWVSALGESGERERRVERERERQREREREREGGGEREREIFCRCSNKPVCTTSNCVGSAKPLLLHVSRYRGWASCSMIQLIADIGVRTYGLESYTLVAARVRLSCQEQNRLIRCPFARYKIQSPDRAWSTTSWHRYHSDVALFDAMWFMLCVTSLFSPPSFAADLAFMLVHVVAAPPPPTHTVYMLMHLEYAFVCLGLDSIVLTLLLPSSSAWLTSSPLARRVLNMCKY